MEIKVYDLLHAPAKSNTCVIADGDVIILHVGTNELARIKGEWLYVSRLWYKTHYGYVKLFCNQWAQAPIEVSMDAIGLLSEKQWKMNLFTGELEDA